MKVKNLKSMLNNFPDDMEVWIEDILKGMVVRSVYKGQGWSDGNPSEVVYLSVRGFSAGESDDLATDLAT